MSTYFWLHVVFILRQHMIGKGNPVLRKRPRQKCTDEPHRERDTLPEVGRKHCRALVQSWYRMRSTTLLLWISASRSPERQVRNALKLSNPVLIWKLWRVVNVVHLLKGAGSGLGFSPRLSLLSLHWQLQCKQHYMFSGVCRKILAHAHKEEESKRSWNEPLR